MMNTTVVNRKIVFLKDDAGWYADMEGSRSQNAMVSGADKMIEALANGRSRVEMVFSSDVEHPGDHVMKLHRIEHDPWGATYRVSDGTSGRLRSSAVRSVCRSPGSATRPIASSAASIPRTSTSIPSPRRKGQSASRGTRKPVGLPSGLRR